MAIDDYDYRTARCTRSVTTKYNPGGKGAEPIEVTRPCCGMNQFRPAVVGGDQHEPWVCMTCQQKQNVLRKKVKL